MAKVYIDGHEFETDKAKWHTSLDRIDNYGGVYQSPTGIFYVREPSHWSNHQVWEITSAEIVLELYGEYLDEGDVEYLTECEEKEYL